MAREANLTAVASFLATYHAPSSSLFTLSVLLSCHLLWKVQGAAKLGNRVSFLVKSTTLT